MFLARSEANNIVQYLQPLVPWLTALEGEVSGERMGDEREGERGGEIVVLIVFPISDDRRVTSFSFLSLGLTNCEVNFT